MKKPETRKATSKQTIEVSEFVVTRVHNFDTRVVFDMILNGIQIYGAAVVEGKNGDFISWPSKKGSDGKYYSHVYANLSEKDSAAIIAEVERMLNAEE